MQYNLVNKFIWKQKMLSPQSKYAIRAMIYLSKQDLSDYTNVELIAKKTNSPAPYLSKIINMLVEQELIISRRGKNGGVRVNSAKDEISFYDICVAVEDPIVKSECDLFNRLCDKANPCAFHNNWSSTKQKLLTFLRITNLSNV